MTSNQSFKRELVNYGDDDSTSEQPAVKSAKTGEEMDMNMTTKNVVPTPKSVEEAPRELITNDDDDSTSEQPAVKSAKTGEEQIPPPGAIELQKKVIEPEEPLSKSEKDSQQIPSIEVFDLQKKNIELQEKLLMSDRNLQGACRIAAEAKARVQFLEILLDSKPKAADGVKKKGREGEMEKKLSDLTIQLEEERIRHRLKIDELSSKIVHYEGLLKPPQMPHPQQQMLLMQQLQQQRQIAMQPPPMRYPQQQPQQHSALLCPNRMQQPPFPRMMQHITAATQLHPMQQLQQQRIAVQPRMMQQPQQRTATVLPPLTQQHQPAAKKSLPMQHSQQKPVAISLQQVTEEVTIRANFTGISELTREKVYSESSELAGIALKMFVFSRPNSDKFDIEFGLEVEKKESPLGWSCRVAAELQFYSEHFDNVVNIRRSEKCFSENTRVQGLAGFPLLYLKDNGFLIDDSIMVAVVIKALPIN